MSNRRKPRVVEADTTFTVEVGDESYLVDWARSLYIIAQAPESEAMRVLAALLLSHCREMQMRLLVYPETVKDGDVANEQIHAHGIDPGDEMTVDSIVELARKLVDDGFLAAPGRLVIPASET